MVVIWGQGAEFTQHHGIDGIANLCNSRVFPTRVFSMQAKILVSPCVKRPANKLYEYIIIL